MCCGAGIGSTRPRHAKTSRHSLQEVCALLLLFFPSVSSAAASKHLTWTARCSAGLVSWPEASHSAPRPASRIGELRTNPNMTIFRRSGARHKYSPRLRAWTLNPGQLCTAGPGGSTQQRRDPWLAVNQESDRILAAPAFVPTYC